MPQIDVYPLPSLVDPARIKGSTAVVIDTLRATTSMICAAAAGAVEIIPLLDIDEAKRLKNEAPDGTVLLGGERKGVRIDGFDLGNSPESFTPEVVAGKTLIFTTTNGTVALHAARPADRILLASLVNATAVVKELSTASKSRSNIVILCAGTNGEATEEDLITAGCLVHRLCKLENTSNDSSANDPWELNFYARHVKELWEACFLTTFNVDGVKRIEEFASYQMLVELLRQSRGGKNLVELGLDADIAFAARIDLIKVVPELDPKTMKIS